MQGLVGGRAELVGNGAEILVEEVGELLASSCGGVLKRGKGLVVLLVGFEKRLKGGTGLAIGCEDGLRLRFEVGREGRVLRKLGGELFEVGKILGDSGGIELGDRRGG